MKRYKPKDIKLNLEQQKELDRITNEIIDKILSDEHLQGWHILDPKKYCPICIKERENSNPAII